MKANKSAQGYGEYIRTLIEEWPVNKPITTDVVAAELAETFFIDIVSAKKITNVNMKRISDKGEVLRVQKGIYGKVENTQFGILKPSADEIMASLLLRDGDKIIGHIAGPTLLNLIGLSTWMPGKYHIATNGFRRRIPESARICVYRPAVPVNDDNVRYLQAIEAITAMEKFHTDAERPDDILREMFYRNNIDNEKLIWYARKYYSKRTLLRTIDVALGGLDYIL